VPPGLGYILSPGVKSVAGHQEAVAQVGITGAQPAFQLKRQGLNVLGVGNDGDPDAVLVGGDAGESLDHFVAGQFQDPC